MAKVTVVYKEVIRPIDSVTLTINHDELLTLTAILYRIGGDLSKSPRKHAASILNAIMNGVDPELRDYEKVRELVDVDVTKPAGTIYFGDYK
jgi:hypothetical protein